MFLAGIALYFIGLIAFSLFFSRKMQGMKDFFLAGRQLPMWYLLVTILAAWVGAASTMGTMNEAYNRGLGAFWLMAVPAVISCGFNGLVLAKKVRETGFSSMPEAVFTAYGPVVSILFSGVILMATTTLISSQLFACGQIIEAMTGLAPLSSVIAIYLAIVFYSAVGGFRTVVVTDLFQFALIVFALLTLLGFVVFKTLNNPLGINVSLPTSYFDLTVDLPKHLAITLTFSLAWCLAPELWQRVAALPSIGQAKKLVLGATICFPALYAVVIFTGMLAKHLYPQAVTSSTGNIFMVLVQQLPYEWLAVMVLVGIIAAIASTIDSSLNVATMTISQDILNRFFLRQINPSQQVLLSRISTVFIGIPAVVIALYYSSLIQILWISADIYASCLFVPVMAFFYFRKYCCSLPAILSIGLGLLPVVTNFLIDFKLLIAPDFWPSYPYTTLLGLFLSLIGFVWGVYLIQQNKKTPNDLPS